MVALGFLEQLQDLWLRVYWKQPLEIARLVMQYQLAQHVQLWVVSMSVFEPLVDGLVLQKLAAKVDVGKNVAEVLIPSADSGNLKAERTESGQARVETRVLLMRDLSLLRQG